MAPVLGLMIFVLEGNSNCLTLVRRFYQNWALKDLLWWLITLIQLYRNRSVHISSQYHHALNIHVRQYVFKFETSLFFWKKGSDSFKKLLVQISKYTLCKFDKIKIYSHIVTSPQPRLSNHSIAFWILTSHSNQNKTQVFRL